MRIQIAKGEDPLEGSALKFQIRSSGKIYAILIRSYHRFFHLCIATFLASCLHFPIHPNCIPEIRFQSFDPNSLVSPCPYRFERSVHHRIQNSNKLCSQYRAKKTEPRNSIPVVKISVPRRITRRLTVVTVGQEARLREERYHPPFHGSFCEK